MDNAIRTVKMSHGQLHRAHAVMDWYGMRGISFIYWYWPRTAALHYGWKEV